MIEDSGMLEMSEVTLLVVIEAARTRSEGLDREAPDGGILLPLVHTSTAHDVVGLNDSSAILQSVCQSGSGDPLLQKKGYK